SGGHERPGVRDAGRQHCVRTARARHLSGKHYDAGNRRERHSSSGGAIMTTPTHPQQVAKSASAKKMLMSDLMQTVGILPILILIVAVFGFIAPNFFTESNLLNITRQASINIVLAAGMTFI